MGTKAIALAVFLAFFTGPVDSFSVVDMLSVQNCSIIAKFQAEKLIKNVTLIFYTGNDTSEFIRVPLKQPELLLENEKFNKSRCMVLYMFGFVNTPRSENTNIIANAYLELQEYNFIVVDWSSITINHPYNVAVSLMNYLAPHLAKAVDTLIKAGVQLCHLSGHSLGAQGVGAVARNMKHRVKYLIALDPAGPLFSLPFPCARSISKLDAERVEVMHTDGGIYGTLFPIGHVDYFVNGGSRTQPGCGDINLPIASIDILGCSHTRALYIMAEGMRKPSKLLSVRCSSQFLFLAGRCTNNIRANITIHETASEPGWYFLRTNSSKPFGLGLDGIKSPSKIVNYMSELV